MLPRENGPLGKQAYREQGEHASGVWGGTVVSVANLRAQTDGMGMAWRERRYLAYPDSTPRTRLRTKKDPMMMRGMKYSQFQVAPKASLVWRGKENKNQHDVMFNTSTQRRGRVR